MKAKDYSKLHDRSCSQKYNFFCQPTTFDDVTKGSLRKVKEKVKCMTQSCLHFSFISAFSIKAAENQKGEATHRNVFPVPSL